MKNRLIKLIAFMFAFFFMVDMQVGAAQINCYYQDVNGKDEIKLTIETTDLSATMYRISDGNVDGEAKFFYPINYLQILKGREVVASYEPGCYFENGGNNCQESVYACPTTLTNYYTNTPFDYVVNDVDSSDMYDNFDGQSIPAIEFSNEGVKLDANGKIELTDTGDYIYVNLKEPDASIEKYYKDYCINNTKYDGCMKYNGKKEYYFKNKDTSSSTEELKSCLYRNSSGQYLKFNFVSKQSCQNYWPSDIFGNTNGDVKKSCLDSHIPEKIVYLNCPEFVNFTTPELGTFSTDMCYADSDNCYTRVDIDMTYEDNASKVITYYDTTNSNSTIKFKVLKMPDDNGKEYKIVLNDNKEISHVNEMSKYYDVLKLGTSDTYPGYIYEKNGSYTISEKEPNVYKKENTEGYDRVYMLGLGMLEIQGFGGDKIKVTCKSMFDDSFINLVKRNFFRLIYIGVPILLLVLTTFDFAQVVFVDDKDGIQNAFKKFKKRLVVAVLIYFVPVILNTLIDIVGVDKVGECIKTFTELK